MKTLLAILLCFLVTEAPVLAIHGGYSLGGSQSVTGTYAGVMIPTSDTSLVTGTTVSDFGQNALGLFTLGIPTTGLGSGTVYLFSGGQQFTGTIQALPDPSNDGGIVGVIAATGEITTAASATNFIGLAQTQVQNQVTGQASGGLTASVVASTNSVSTDGLNLSGTSSVVITTSTTSAATTSTTPTNETTTTGGVTEFLPTEQIVFAVEGFQQSDFAAPSTTTTTQ